MPDSTPGQGRPVPAPEPVARVAALFATFKAPWALCGGWAVDAWLGRITRDHFDVDITIYSEDQGTLFDHLREWTLIPHDSLVPDSKEPWDGRELVLPAHIHAAESPEVAFAWVNPSAADPDGLKLDLELNKASEDGWVLHPEPRVVYPREAAFAPSRWGMPAVVPAILAFYKATAYFDNPAFSGRRPHDETDFRLLWGMLDRDSQRWLRDAVATVRPEHPWF